METNRHIGFIFSALQFLSSFEKKVFVGQCDSVFFSVGLDSLTVLVVWIIGVRMILGLGLVKLELGFVFGFKLELAIEVLTIGLDGLKLTSTIYFG